jgi:DNA-binding response OmpR family regulator
MAKHSVLIVDQQRSVLEDVKHVLSDDGYAVNVAASTREALDLMGHLEVELLVINPAMPVLSGVEAAKLISQEKKCKVLFLSDLAKDVDFREMLRGLRQQGCECSAISVPFERTELLAYVRREIGIAEPSSARVPLLALDPDGAAAAPARAPVAEYDLLFNIVGPRLYECNAFRVTGLPVDASLRDISRKADRLEMTAKLGVNDRPPGPFFAIALTSEEVRTALQCLKTPDQRLLHEFFWFWPTSGSNENDPALVAVNTGNIKEAEGLWRESAMQLNSPRPDFDRRGLLENKPELERAAVVSLHNLAILYHIRALGVTAEGSTGRVPDDTDRAKFWKTSFSYWLKIRNQHVFWDVLRDRIRKMNDPRLRDEVAEMIWTSLPLALISLNAQLAVAAAESRDFEEAGLQRRVMKESGFSDFVRDALCRKLKPLQEELAHLCETAESESLKEPENAVGTVKKLFEDKKMYLQTFNYLLGAGDSQRDAVHDLVAQTARTCLVAYVNKTEKWENAQPLFEECLALAESNSLRSRLEDDLETLAGNVAAKREASRTQATAAHTQQTPKQQQPPSGSTADPIQSGRSPSRSHSFAATMIVLVFIAILLIVSIGKDNKSDNTPSTSSPPPTSPADSAGDTTTSGTQSTSVDTGELESLKTTIESNRASLNRMSDDLSGLDKQIAALKSKMDSDHALLDQIEHDHDARSPVDVDLFESTRQGYNSTVAKSDELIEQYNSELRAYKSLLKSTNSQIEHYNAVARSQ